MSEESRINVALVFMVLGGLGFLITHLAICWNVFMYNSVTAAIISFLLPGVSTFYWLAVVYSNAGYFIWLHYLFIASLACIPIYMILALWSSKKTPKKEAPAAPAAPVTPTPPAPPVMPAEPGQRRYSPGVEAYMQLQRQAGQKTNQ